MLANRDIEVDLQGKTNVYCKEQQVKFKGELNHALVVYVNG